MEPTDQSTSSDFFYTDNVNENVEVYHAAEPEDKEENPEESIGTNDLPSTADLSEREEPTQRFLMNRNNNLQQPLRYKQILRSAVDPGSDERDLKCSV